jgi:uncharacterized protein
MSLAEIAVPTFIQLIGSVSSFLDKAAAHAETRKIDPAVLLGTRLFPDMFPLIRQVQLVSDFAKGTTARLAGLEPPKYADEEKTIDELKARLTKTVEFIKSLDRAAIDAAADKDITFPAGGGTQRTLKGTDYLVLSGLPNFYFHVTTAYNILRHCGVELGKRDFLGRPPST